MIHNIWMAMATFAGVAALDIVWAGYTIAMVEKKAVTSSVYAMAIYAFGGLIIIGYTDHPWLLFPAVAGAFCGTYIAVWWAGRKIADIKIAGMRLSTWWRLYGLNSKGGL